LQVKFGLQEEGQSSDGGGVGGGAGGGGGRCSVGNLDSVSKWTPQRVQLWIKVAAAAAAFCPLPLIPSQLLLQCPQCDMWLLATSHASVKELLLAAAGAGGGMQDIASRIRVAPR
jgi:hypothetical protein